MYTKFISKIIQEKLKAKERALSRSSKPIQDQEPDGSLDLKKLLVEPHLLECVRIRLRFLMY